METWDLRRHDLDYAFLRRLVDQWRDVADNYYGDFCPLTPYRMENDVWMAWQFDRPEVGGGMVQVFRRPKSSIVAIDRHGLITPEIGFDRASSGKSCVYERPTQICPENESVQGLEGNTLSA